MKRKLLLAFSAALLSTGLMAGGIMTNSNQSASYARMLARNASLGIDAVYYNPAGLTKLGKGFYFSLNNQSIFQTKDVTNNYPYLNGSPDAKYTGIVKAPVFPGVYAVYKLNKFAFSFGFNPVGGGGGAKYDTGLPSFEMPISDLKPMLAPKDASSPDFKITDYSADINFEGTSVFFGYQAGVSYEINHAISVFAGLRYVTAKNTYKGSITNIMLNPNYTASPAIPNFETPTFGGGFVRADEFATKMKNYYSAGATYYTGVASQMNGAASSLAPMITGGIGGLTPAQAASAGYITSTQKAQIEGGLAAIGQPTSLTIAQAQGAFSATAAGATTGAAKMTGGVASMSALATGTGDMEVDVVQKGMGYTPILGANLTIAEKLTVAIKYEFLTKIELTNKTKVDGTGSFPDGAKSRSDMPALLSIGTSYPVTPKLTASLGYNLYFDKSANYGKKIGLEYVSNESVIDKNFFELALGLEYHITDKFLVSAGYLRSQTGVSKAYQSDLSYSLTSNTGAIGGQYKITPGIILNLGALVTKYNKGDRSFIHSPGAPASNPGTENLAKTTWLMSIGLDVRIGK